ncbi:MAG: glycosyltransferase, partial [Caldilineaceae bacterium]|nr:glycosyltransferase [Caldilineaceae bacterium]
MPITQRPPSHESPLSDAPNCPTPPHQGTTIRNYNLIRHLAAHHTIDLLTFLAPGERLEAENPLHAHCRRIATAAQPLRTTQERLRSTVGALAPDMALRLESPEMHDLTAEFVAAGRYDIVQAEGIEMAQYGVQAISTALRGPDPEPALIFDDHNCEYLLQQRNAFNDLRSPRRWLAAGYSLVQWRKLRRYEAAICRRAAATVTVSNADRDALLSLAPEAKVTVVSNGINLDDYETAGAVQLDQPLRLVFTGKMDYRPNIDAVLWFANQVLPLIQARAEGIRFQIVGRNSHPRLDGLRSNPAIEITGAVAETTPYIQAAAAYVIPMRVGGGTRFKALEAMACAVPTVSTRLGVEGIEVQSGREMLLADSAQEFADAVCLLLEDVRAGGDERRRLGQHARRFVETYYSW